MHVLRNLNPCHYLDIRHPVLSDSLVAKSTKLLTSAFTENLCKTSTGIRLAMVCWVRRVSLNRIAGFEARLEAEKNWRF